jgi:hypothetical protein
MKVLMAENKNLKKTTLTTQRDSTAVVPESIMRLVGQNEELSKAAGELN